MVIGLMDRLLHLVKSERMAIPIIDIFAGPGGLGEGFSALTNDTGDRLFKIALSIEKDESAHQTLTLRSFYRQFKKGELPDDYYEFLRGKIKLDELYRRWPQQASLAKEEAWLATLGSKKRSTPHEAIDERIKKALQGNTQWVLIGGPPCQAYSVIGRVRKRRKTLNENKDERVGLYKQYLRILALHNPSIFVMENVRGLLTAKTKDSPVFAKMLRDLSDPAEAYKIDFKSNGQEVTCKGYKIYSLVKRPKKYDANGNPILDHKDYLIRSEDFGVPQTRHRVILIGVRNDIDLVPAVLRRRKRVSVSKVINDLPRLRSKISRCKDDGQKWKEAILRIIQNNDLHDCDRDVNKLIRMRSKKISLPHLGVGKEFIEDVICKPKVYREWYMDSRIWGCCNHVARSHMERDLHRYFFAACFARKKNRSPQLADFPVALLPAHGNVFELDGEITKKFADRFKVQVARKPSKTITSHISQDGHYYIHYDPTQCRSFTVREAARIQTFPDNYYFCGPRTSQFIQVGNAVPPLLANQIARIVHNLFGSISTEKETKVLNQKLETVNG